MNVQQWVEVFQAAGMDDSTMHRWHREFEQRYPEQHEQFLKWLGMPAEEILKVRKAFKAS